MIDLTFRDVAGNGTVQIRITDVVAVDADPDLFDEFLAGADRDREILW